MKVKCIKVIQMERFSENDDTYPANFTLGEVYEFASSGEYIVDDVGNKHYMPSPLNERDEYDGWATSDYFEVI